MTVSPHRPAPVKVLVRTAHNNCYYYMTLKCPEVCTNPAKKLGQVFPPLARAYARQSRRWSDWSKEWCVFVSSSESSALRTSHETPPMLERRSHVVASLANVNVDVKPTCAHARRAAAIMSQRDETLPNGTRASQTNWLPLICFSISGTGSSGYP